MRVIVLGAGVVGTAAAWYLNRAGHEVTVIERQPAAGLETSFANGGQISVSHAEPWANPGAPWKALKWMWREDAPLLFRLRADPAQWRWGIEFLRQCSSARSRHNMTQLVRLGMYSRDQLDALRGQTGIEYDHLCRGILHYYTDPKEFEAALEPARIMRELGCERVVLDPAAAVEIEPALASMRDGLAGATYTSEDESGDAHLFTQRLAALASTQGVSYRYAHQVLALLCEGGRLVGVRVNDGSQVSTLKADAYVVALGSYSPLLLAPLGIRLLIYPAKGYSATIPVVQPDGAPHVSLTDDEYKIVFSRLGERLRVAGTAEFNGYNLELNMVRCHAITRRATQLFGAAIDGERAEYWTGLRPATPSNVPYIGRTRLANLYLNTGHGTLGWTHACGSGRALADIIGGRTPEVDFAFCR